MQKTDRLHFRMRLLKSLQTATGPRRDELYVLSTAIWTEKVKEREPFASYYAMEKFFEPDAFGKNVNGSYHRNKWSKYAVGLSRPSMKLIGHVENIYPNTQQIIEHPIWEILRAGTTKNIDISLWINRLSPQIQSIYHWNYKNQSTVQLQMAERRAGIDALALISILLLEAINNDARKMFIHRAMCSLYSVLIITCLELPYRGFSDELFDCFNRRIFMQTHPEGCRLGLELIEVKEVTRFLLFELHRMETRGKIKTDRNSIIRVLLKLLGGSYGFDLRYALNPPYVSAADNLDHETRKFIERSRKRWEWGLQVLREGRIERFPPRDL
jgi:hypothetical protein